MSLERAKEHLKKFNKENDIKLFDVSSATVELAAKALGCRPEFIAKTLSFKLKDRVILIVFAGDTKVDNAKYKATFLEKARMLEFAEVESLIGHAVGGVCPFGVNEGVDTYLDVSLKRFDIVYPACGTANSAIPLTVEELYKISGALDFVDVGKIIGTI